MTECFGTTDATLYKQMLNKLKAEWRELKASPPGQRFEQCYERHQARDAPWLKPILFFSAVFSFVIAIVLAFIPGPAILFFLISGALLACESRPVARGFDKVELTGRRLFAAYRSKRKHRQSRAGTRAGHLEEQQLASLRAAAEAGPREAPHENENVSSEAVHMGRLEVSDAPVPAIDLSRLHAPDASTPAAPIDMSKLQVPLADTREIHAQAIAQANLSRHQAERAQQAATAADAQPAAPLDMSQMQFPASSERMANPEPIPPLPEHFAASPRVPNIALVPPPAPDKRRVQLSLQAPGHRPDGESVQAGPTAAPQQRVASTEQGAGPEERPLAQVRALRVPSPRSAGTMKIWTADTTPHPNVFQNVQRVIKQSAKSDASVVLLAPPAIIGEKKRRSRPSARRERPATPPPPPKH